jgi:hypothetical protein
MIKIYIEMMVALSSVHLKKLTFAYKKIKDCLVNVINVLLFVLNVMVQLIKNVLNVI